MRPPELRDEQPPDDAVVVIRGGLYSLDAEKVIEVCEDSFADFGFYGLSVFAALNGDVEGLCQRFAGELVDERTGERSRPA